MSLQAQKWCFQSLKKMMLSTLHIGGETPPSCFPPLPYVPGPPLVLDTPLRYEDKEASAKFDVAGPEKQ